VKNALKKYLAVSLKKITVPIFYPNQEQIKNYKNKKIPTAFNKTDRSKGLIYFGGLIAAPQTPARIFTSKNDWVDPRQDMRVRLKRGTGWEANDHSKNGYWLVDRLAAEPIPNLTIKIH